MSSARYTSEFKDEAVQKIADLGYSVAEVSERFSVSAHSLQKTGKGGEAGQRRRTGRGPDREVFSCLQRWLKR